MLSYRNLTLVGFWVVSAAMNSSIVSSILLPGLDVPLWCALCIAWMICALPCVPAPLRLDQPTIILLGFLLAFLAIQATIGGLQPVHPFKIYFFTFAVTVFWLNLPSLATRDREQQAVFLLGLYVIYVLAVMATIALQSPAGPTGANQHQFYLNGLLSFATALAWTAGTRVRPELRLLLVLFALGNIVTILSVTLSRQMLPYGAAVIVLTVTISEAREISRRWTKVRTIVIATALVLSFALPLAHLAGYSGNALNIGAATFSKVRDASIVSERERAFRIWSERAVGKPELVRLYDGLPVVGMVGKRGEVMATPALTSSHNLWLDASVRFGWIYVMLMVAFLTWLLSGAISIHGRGKVLREIAVVGAFSAWLFASHFDDEHFFYHIPFITLPLVLLARGASAVPEGATVPNSKPSSSVA